MSLSQALNQFAQNLGRYPSPHNGNIDTQPYLISGERRRFEMKTASRPHTSSFVSKIAHSTPMSCSTMSHAAVST